MPLSTPGNLLYIPNFTFKNGTSKDKYFLIVACTDQSIVVASLPSSQNHVPSQLTIEHGCIDNPTGSFNCYHFEANRTICQDGFSFPKPTFIYSEWVDMYTNADLSKIISYEMKGKLTKRELASVIECFKNSKKTIRKIKKLLA